MKAIVVYYSLEGNTDYAAKLIAEELGADLLRIDTEKPYPTDKTRFMVGGKDAMMGAAPKLKEYSFNANEYDTVVFGTPLWAWTFAPALRTFFNENPMNGKKLAFFVSSGGGKDEKAFVKMQKAVGTENAPCLSLIDPLNKKKDSDLADIKAFAEKIKAL